MELDPKLKRLLARVAKGDAPRCSVADYGRLQALPGMRAVLQLESANGADRSGGMILTDLHGNGGSSVVACKLLDEITMEEVQQDKPKAARGRPRTGNAKTAAERNKSADEALVLAGGRVLRARLAPEAARALAELSKRFGSDKTALDAALVFAEKNIK